MKRFLIIAGLIAATSAIAIFAYLKGHRDGVTQADARSLSYEIPIFDGFGKTTDDPKVKLGHLIAFRHGWLNSNLSPLESWSYWRHVDTEEFMKVTSSRVQEIANQFPTNERPSEQAAPLNGP